MAWTDRFTGERREWMWTSRIDSCNCYVRLLGRGALSTLRYGAHDPSCAVYRESLDPEDKRQDQATLRQYQLVRLFFRTSARTRPL